MFSFFSSIFWKISSFLRFFFSKSNTNLLLFFPETGNQWCSIFGAVTHKFWVYHRVNVFKLPAMVYYNRKALMVLINKAKYIHLSTHVFNFSDPYHFAHISHSKIHSSFTYFAKNASQVISQHQNNIFQKQNK